jgi:hypothetical protein
MCITAIFACPGCQQPDKNKCKNQANKSKQKSKKQKHFQKIFKKNKNNQKNQAESSGENQKSKIKKNQLKKYRNSLIVIKIRCSGLFLSPCIQASFQI